MGADGKPLIGANGCLLGADGQPLKGPNGCILGADGQPIIPWSSIWSKKDDTKNWRIRGLKLKKWLFSELDDRVSVRVKTKETKWRFDPHRNKV